MAEGDDSKAKGGVPSWQLKPSGAPQEDKAEEQEPTQDAPSRTTIIENARRFLQEDEVRDAPTDKQVAFLESKGLESDEIQELLGIARNAEATGSPPESTASIEAPSKESPSPASPPNTPPTSLAPSSSQASRDLPPVITYPEFLVKPPRPAPLVTASRLLTTLYIFGGLSALLYGANQYMITPMIAALTSSRHEFAENTQAQLDKLISKLQGMVSETPQSLLASKQEDSEEDDSDSDPTELFHRDIGVQTSLPSSPTQSRPSTPPPANDISADQTSRIEKISAYIKDLNESSTSEGQDTANLTTTFNVLRDYLDSLAYVPPSYSYGAGSMYGSANQKTESANDEISKVKAQIRGVKGVLLSARSFPAGTAQGRVR